MRKFGLIGYPLSHSFSKKYFTEKFEREGIKDCSYDIYPLEKVDELKSLIIANSELCGLNVTIPYKSAVISLLDDVSTEATAIGAVNVISISRTGGKDVMKGFNSDVFGFRESILPYIKNSSSNALILGTGGASKAVTYVFRKLGISYTLVSREKKNGVITYHDLSRDVIENHEIIVNTTPAGMYPSTENYPEIPYKYLDSRHFLYDLVYNPEFTNFMKKGREAGCVVIGGLKMLHLQAEKSWEIWNSNSV